MSGHPLLGLKRHIHQCLQVIEPERGPIAPHPGLILQRAGEGRGEEGTLLAGALPDRRLDVAASQCGCRSATAGGLPHDEGYRAIELTS